MDVIKCGACGGDVGLCGGYHIDMPKPAEVKVVEEVKVEVKEDKVVDPVVEKVVDPVVEKPLEDAPLKAVSPKKK